MNRSAIVRHLNSSSCASLSVRASNIQCSVDHSAMPSTISKCATQDKALCCAPPARMTVPLPAPVANVMIVDLHSINMAVTLDFYVCRIDLTTGYESHGFTSITVSSLHKRVVEEFSDPVITSKWLRQVQGAAWKMLIFHEETQKCQPLLS